MLITVDELKKTYSDMDFSKFTDERLKRKLSSIENAIREHTHNNFNNRNIKTTCYAKDNYITGDFTYFKKGDTIEIYSSSINDGLYVINEKISNNEIKLDRDIFDCNSMIIAKVEYPIDIIDGCVEMLDYDCNYRNKSKRGIASESISRHSVSYVQNNSSNTLKGYPIELLGFLEPYIRWRT